jgi:hypothetical protein
MRSTFYHNEQPVTIRNCSSSKMYCVRFLISILHLERSKVAWRSFGTFRRQSVTDTNRVQVLATFTAYISHTDNKIDIESKNV